MDSKQYIKDAIKTEATNFADMGERLSEKGNIRLLHGAIGLSTEVGEFMDALKKHVFYAKELDRVNLSEELGDMFWYMAIISDELGVDFEAVMKTNIDKLKARYGDKFSEEKAENRDLEKEREIFEKQRLS